jgi:hypothetical protein
VYEHERVAPRSKRSSRVTTPRVASPEQAPSRPMTATNGHTPVPRPSRSPDTPAAAPPAVARTKANAMEVDADADGDADAEAEADADADADVDADAEADADAELLEAVDAAEANNASSGEEWLKKEDS